MFKDEAGNLWFATSQGLTRYDGETWSVVADQNDLGAEGTLRVFQDSKNRLWVTLLNFKNGIGTGCGVARSAPITTTGAVTGWQTFTKADGLAGDFVYSIAEDDEGNIWFGTLDGVSRFDGENWETFKSDNSDLPDNLVSQVIPMYEYEIWAATDKGVAKYVDEEWQKFGDYQSTLSIFEDSKGRVWFSNVDEGLDYYTGDNRKIFSKANGDLASDEIRNVFETNDGAIWASSCAGIDTYSLAQSCNGGVSRYKDGKWQIFNSESGDLGSDDVRDVFESSDGTIWVGMWGTGVSYHQNGEWHRFDKESGNPKDGNVWELLESSDGSIWIGTAGGGVSRYQDGKWETFSIENGDLNDNYIRYILESSDGAIWIETPSSGVSRYQNGEWQTFTEENSGLISNHLGYLREGTDGAIWVWYPEVGGLSRYQDESWQSFPNKNLEDMPVKLKSSSTQPLLVDKDGFAWTVTDDGLVRRRLRPPWIEIVRVNSNPLTTTALTLSNEEPQRIFIDFAGDDLVTRPENLQYLYKLEKSSGDTDWQQATYNRPIIFEELDSGEHTLLVKAIDEDELESEPAKLDITVEEPPLTPSEWLMRGLVVTALFGLVVFGGNWRRRRKATQWDIQHHFNPFISEVAVKEPKMFFGRQEILDDVLRSIQATNFVIYGEKRIGKTSLLHQIDHRLSEMGGKYFDYLPLVVSLHAMSEERFFRDLMRKMVARIKGKGRYPADGLFLECHEEADMPYDSISFNGDLETLQSALDAQSDLPLRVVLLVDEGDVLKRYSQDTLAQLRETFMVWAGDYLKIVLTCEGPDERDWQLEGSPWMSIFGKQYRLTPFTDEEARELIVEPVPNYRYQPEAIERILQRSQLVPRHIQNICRQTINEMLADKTGRITLDHVESALPKVENLSPDVTNEEEEEEQS